MTSPKRVARRLLLGDAPPPQQVSIALDEPQQEVAVLLVTPAGTADVTHLHSVACASPFTVCIGLEGQQAPTRATLEFRRRCGDQLLASITLKYVRATRTGAPLALFTAASCTIPSLPAFHARARHLRQAWWRWRDKTVPNVRMSFLNSQCMAVMFLCPRPVVLVTAMRLCDGQCEGNIFPMNLMGCLGNQRIGFALNSERLASQCVKHAERIALSSVPFEKAALARQLGPNHVRAKADWNALPFAVDTVRGFGLPVPAFASVVREVHIETILELGSHTFLIAHILREERYGARPGFFMAHGLYETTKPATGAGFVTAS